MIKSVIIVYKKVTGWLREAQVPFFTYSTCKFYPSCSEYAGLAVEKHGFLKGTGLTASRVIRCNPLSHGGVDYP